MALLLEFVAVYVVGGMELLNKEIDFGYVAYVTIDSHCVLWAICQLM
jgi:hypothetical protein